MSTFTVTTGIVYILFNIDPEVNQTETNAYIGIISAIGIICTITAGVCCTCKACQSGGDYLSHYLLYF